MVSVAPTSPPLEPKRTRPVNLALRTGGSPGVANVTMSPVVYPAFRAVASSRATSSTPAGSLPSVSVRIRTPVMAVMPV